MCFFAADNDPSVQIVYEQRHGSDPATRQKETEPTHRAVQAKRGLLQAVFSLSCVGLQQYLYPPFFDLSIRILLVLALLYKKFSPPLWIALLST
jgi:hypothetical protein